MKKIILTMALIISIIINTGNISFAGKYDDKAEIEATINTYFDLKYASYGKLEIQKGFNEFFVNNKKTDDEKIIVDTMIKFRKMQLEDLTFDKYSINGQ
ncbi:MAG: hypothetical protein IJM37_00575 [Lachnospiraceae bacterium]|nr:hypothetical protein [Lachnospiraceae bacterium]